MTRRRNKSAALKLLGKLMKRYGRPKAIVTDRLPSYGAALKAVGAEDLQATGRWLNNRELAPAASHSSVHNLFNQERHLSSRNIFKLNRTAALEQWRQLCVA